MRIVALVLVEPWSDFVARLTAMGRDAERGALELVTAIAITLAGWALASIVARITLAVLKGVRFDAGVRQIVGRRSPLRHEPAALAAWAVYWIILVFAGLLALEMLGFEVRNSVGARLGDVVPRIVTSAVLLSLGALGAILLGGVTRRFLATAGVRASRFWGQIVTAVLTGFAILLALEQLGFAAQFVMLLGIAGVAAVGLGVALAFGLGCRDLARDFLVEYLRSLDDDSPKKPS